MFFFLECYIKRVTTSFDIIGLQSNNKKQHKNKYNITMEKCVEYKIILNRCLDSFFKKGISLRLHLSY